MGLLASIKYHFTGKYNVPSYIYDHIYNKCLNHYQYKLDDGTLITEIEGNEKICIENPFIILQPCGNLFIGNADENGKVNTAALLVRKN